MEARRMIVAVELGPLDGRKAVIAPGEALRVGRGEMAGLVVPHDGRMSAVHLEITWDGLRGHFRDLRSATGTLLNGEPGHAEGDLRNGDWLKAGETFLSVHVEGATPARAPDDEGEEAEEARRRQAALADRALARLADEAGLEPLYAVLDAARDRRITELIRESVEDSQSLYDGVQGQTLAHVAPYLVRLPPGSRLLGSLVREGWTRRWGIYLTSRIPFTEVRRQLRRFLMIELEETDAAREVVYFRFYDPRTLVDFLPGCTPRQAEDFFGGIDAFLAEDAGEVRRWQHPDRKALG